MWIQGDKRVVFQKDVHICFEHSCIKCMWWWSSLCTQDHSRGVKSIPQNRNDSSKDTKYGFGHVTSACNDDHYYAHNIILAAGGQFLKTKKGNNKLFFICTRPLVMIHLR